VLKVPGHGSAAAHSPLAFGAPQAEGQWREHPASYRVWLRSPASFGVGLLWNQRCTPARRGGEPSSSSMQAAAPMDITCPQTCQAVVRLMDETGGCQHATPPSPPRHTTTTHWPQQHTSAGTPATSTDPATARTHAHSPFRGGAQPQLRLHPPPEQPHDERIVRLPVEGRVLLVQLARLGDGGDGR